MCINNNQAVSQIKAYSVADPKELQIKWKREREKKMLSKQDKDIKNNAMNKAKTTLYQFEKEDKRRRKKFLMLSSQC